MAITNIRAQHSCRQTKFKAQCVPRLVPMPAHACPDSKVHGANMGPTWGHQDPGDSLLAPWTLLSRWCVAHYGYLLTFWSSNAMWPHRSRSTLAQVRNWSHGTRPLKKKYWLIIKSVLWHQLDTNFTGETIGINPKQMFKDYIFKWLAQPP